MLIKAGIDSQELRQIYKDKEIHLNIDTNFRNTQSEEQSPQYQYFDKELYKSVPVIEHANA